MSNKQIVDLYSEICRKSPFAILASGRYLINSAGYNKRLVNDIVQKLRVSSEDSILDLGCNVGIYHKGLAARAKRVVGVDGAEVTIERARAKNKLDNVEYHSFDILGKWPDLDYKFNKVLVYSVIHFFQSLDDVRALFAKVSEVLNASGAAEVSFLLGEVRTDEQYGEFKLGQVNKTTTTMRDRMFQLNKWLSKMILGDIKGYACTSFRGSDIIAMGEEFGFTVTQLKQQEFHPFYNTCSDFVFVRRQKL